MKNDINDNKNPRSIKPISENSRAIELSKEFNDDTLNSKGDQFLPGSRKLDSQTRGGMIILMIIFIILSFGIITLAITIPWFVARNNFIKGKNNRTFLGVWGLVFSGFTIIGLLASVLILNGKDD